MSSDIIMTVQIYSAQLHSLIETADEKSRSIAIGKYRKIWSNEWLHPVSIFQMKAAWGYFNIQ